MASHSHRPESLPGDVSPDWEEVWSRHAHWLRTVVGSRVEERDAVDDVLQQVALALSKPSGRPSQPEKIGPWLYRVAIRQCLMHRRTAGRRRRLLQRTAEMTGCTVSGESESPLDWLLREERVALAGRALAVLPDLDRQLLLLKYTENWTYQDMADHLGVSLNSVEYRLIQARNRLRRQLLHSGLLETHS